MTELLVEVIIEELVKTKKRKKTKKQGNQGTEKRMKREGMDDIITTGCCSTRKLWTAK